MAHALPALPLDEWDATKTTLHLYAQIVGKIQLAATRPLNHWWNATYRVTARGFATRRMQVGETAFDIEFDLVDHALVVRTDGRARETIPLRDGLSVAEFHETLFVLLGRLGIDVDIKAEPYGVPMTTPFAEDREHASYDREYVERFARVLRWAEWTLQEFSSWFCGKQSPVHLFWHGFDLAMTRFSGARAPANEGADAVTREAYSHKVISFGFWPGDDHTRFPAFYSYTAPEPDDLASEPLAPAGAMWKELPSSHLAVLPYDDVRTAADPRQTLLAFWESAYEAGARRAGWDRAELASGWCPTVPALADLVGQTSIAST
jgi:Family of unknown function (DUF5996)